MSERIIKIEGPAMSGKSFLLDLIEHFLVNEGYEVERKLDDKKNRNSDILVVKNRI